MLCWPDRVSVSSSHGISKTHDFSRFYLHSTLFLEMWCSQVEKSIFYTRFPWWSDRYSWQQFYRQQLKKIEKTSGDQISSLLLMRRNNLSVIILHKLRFTTVNAKKINKQVTILAISNHSLSVSGKEESLSFDLSASPKNNSTWLKPADEEELPLLWVLRVHQMQAALCADRR